MYVSKNSMSQKILKKIGFWKETKHGLKSQGRLNNFYVLGQER